MAKLDEKAGQVRGAAKKAADARRREHAERQAAARWRVVLVGDLWRIFVNRGNGWVEAAEPRPGRSDVGDCEERFEMGSWVRDKVLEVGGIWLDRDYDAAAEGRVAYTVVVSRL